MLLTTIFIRWIYINIQIRIVRYNQCTGIYIHTGTYILSKFYATYINRSSGKRGKKKRKNPKQKNPQNLICYVSNCICIIHISMHKSVSHTHYLYRTCKSPIPLKRENKWQTHTVLLVDSYKKEGLQWEIPVFGPKQSKSASH